MDIPGGMDLDHTCRNASCVEVTHLEPVTALENQRRRPRSGRIQRTFEGDVCESHQIEVAPYREYKGKKYFRCPECYLEYQREYRLGRSRAA
ncbi:MAG: HNH endonuclease [Brevibacterium sp.]